MAETDDLRLVDTGRLIDELTSRFPHIIIVGLKAEGYKNKNYWWEIQGDEIECYGLYVKMGHLLDEHFFNNRGLPNEGKGEG